MASWGTLLLLLLLLGASTSQEEGAENQSPACPRDATRFKHLRKYVYSYEAESSNSVAGTADSSSATRINCKVELEVPRLCSFTLKVNQCTLKEVYGFDPNGKALLRKTKNSDEFAAALSRYELRLSIPDGKKVVLYPEMEEPTHILNIKRGMISTLMAPMDPEKDNRTVTLDTVYGDCPSDITVRARRDNAATEILVDRKLEKCPGFKPITKAASPIAFLKGLGSPLSKLLGSWQECMYTLDPRKKHVEEAVCRERHVFLPFSHRSQYGIVARISQSMKLEDTPKTNRRFFDEDAYQKKGLAFESVETTAPAKEGGEMVLKTLQELQKLSASGQNEHQPKLFSRLVTGLRSLKEDTIASLWSKLLQVSRPLALQALVQCGQPQCYTHILHWLQTEKANPLLVDTTSYIMALMPNPSSQRLREIFRVAQERPSRLTLYALSHVVNKFHQQNSMVSQEVKEVADYLSSQLGDECAGSEEATQLILRVIGNMGRALEEASPLLKASLLKCIQSRAPSLSVQKAAIQALRKMELTEEVQSVLLQTFLDGVAPEDKRLAAYLLLMRQPGRPSIQHMVLALQTEKSEHVRSFVVSHMSNILASDDLSVQDLRSQVEEALRDSQLPTPVDFRGLSQNYQFSKTLSFATLRPFSTRVEGNLLFDSQNHLPKETMLKTTLSVFGLHPTDLFEVGLEGKGYEATLEALFGKEGFFPDTVTKALYWVGGQVPDAVSQALVDHFGYTKEEKREQDIVNGILMSFQKLLKDLSSSEAPEFQAYVRLLGQELGYAKLEDLKVMGMALLRSLTSLRGLPQMVSETLAQGSQSDVLLHYIFMESTIELPTGVGLPLHLSISGLVSPGVKAGVKLQVANMRAELVAKPSLSVEFVTHLGVTVPDFAWSGVQMNTQLYHESGLEARLALANGQMKLAIPAPKKPVKLFKVSNSLHLVSTTTYSKVVPPLMENRKSWTACRSVFPGLDYCSTLVHANASAIEAAPYYPLTGNTRFELELQPTGDVDEYTASATYEVQRQDGGLVDQLRFVVQAQGPKPSEATVTLSYDRRLMALTSALQVPALDVDLGTSMRIQDQSDEENTIYNLTLDLQNHKTTEATLMGHVRCDGKEQGAVVVVFSVPLLEAEARSETLVLRSPERLLVQMDSSVKAFGTTVSKRVSWSYDDKKLELEWNIGSNTEAKKLPLVYLPVPAIDRGSLYAYAEDWMEHKVPHTDMTIRHMGSTFIVATNTWLQRVSQGLPYAQTLQQALSSLQEWDMPKFQLPDNLFLKSDGRLRYTLNKHHVKVDIPLLFGGKSLQQLWPVIWTPALELHAIGLQWPAREFRLPPLTVPKSYPLRVPLLGNLEISTNIYSNYYNWSGFYSVGNTTTDLAQHSSYQCRYHIRADSALDLFSYSLQGSGETTYGHGNNWAFSGGVYVHHSLLESRMNLSHERNSGNDPASRGLLTLNASSELGLQVAFAFHLTCRNKLDLFVKEFKAYSHLAASTIYAKTVWLLLHQNDGRTGHITTESTLRLDSSFFQATNKVTGRYGDGSLYLTSSSSVQDGAVKNTASLTYENSQLTLKSDTTGEYLQLVAAHKLDLTVARQSALLRCVQQVDFRALRVVTLLSGSLSSHGLELNADLMGLEQSSSGAHKATLRIGKDGVSLSATTNLRVLPLTVEYELDAALGLLGASLKMSTNARYQEHSAKCAADGKLALTEVSLGNVCQVTILGTDGKNIFSFRINKEGLVLSNAMVGSYKDSKLEHGSSLAIAGWSLDLTSKMETVLSQDRRYQQSFNVQLQPSSALVTLSNNLKYSALELSNTGRLTLESLTLSLEGNVKGAYGNEEVKHVYVLTCTGLSASYKTDTVAKVQGTELSHRVGGNLAGLASSIDISTSFNSESARFSNIIHAMMEPFVLTVDAHTTGSGHLMLAGKHTGQLYSKFLLKATLLSLAFSHDYKASSSHQLRAKRSVEATLDHRASALLTPAEQSSTWKFKALANKNQYSHELQTYNTQERTGVELRAGATADLAVLDSAIELPYLLNEPINVIDMLNLRTVIDMPQEFSVTGSIKYDKNLNVHVINLPFLESLLAYFERVRGAILVTLQNLQQYLKTINIDLMAREYKVALDQLPQLIDDFLVNFNLKGQIINAKEKLIAFMENLEITGADLQILLENIKMKLTEIMNQLQIYLIQVDQYIKENYDLHILKQSIIELINEKVKELKSFDEYYKIRYYGMKLIQDVYEFVDKLQSQILEKLHELIHQYEIHKQVQVLMEKLVQLANKCKLQETAQKLASYLKELEIKATFEKLRSLVDEGIKQAQTAQFEQLINEANEFLDLLVKALQSFDYDQFVDEVNKRIRELIQKINEEIRALELPQKIEAAKLYAAEVRATLTDYLDQIQDTRLTLITDGLWDVMSSTSVIDIKGGVQEILEDIRDRLYKMDIQREIHHGLQTISQIYITLITYIADWWLLIGKELMDFAEEYHIRDWAEGVKRLVEHGFTVPEIKTVLVTLPSFEVSLRALQRATFQTPEMLVLFTNLRVPSVHINMKKLKELTVPSQFTTPEFSILNTFVVPSFQINFTEIRLQIIRTIDQILSSEFWWPLPEISSLPDLHLPEVNIPEIVLPKIDLNEFQFPDIQIPEFQLSHIPHTVVVPTFGKASAALKITSPLFTLQASGFVENTTMAERSPEILISMTAEGQSSVDVLEFTFQADVHLSAHELKRLIVKEWVKLSNKYLKVEHDSEVVFLGTSVLGKANTLASIHTEKNTVELDNSLSLKLEQQVTFESNTRYSHKLELHQIDFSSQTDLHHELRTLLVLERVAVTSTGTGSWKWACPHFSDEGSHHSQLRFTVEGMMTSLNMSSTINSKHIKVNQSVSSESGFLSFAKLKIQSEIESEHVGQSVLNIQGVVFLAEMRGELTGTHDAHLNGRVTGTLKNSLSATVKPFEFGAEVTNEGTVKVSFPLKLVGKIDFLNNYALLLSCHGQQVSWQSAGRFNQYRYSYNISAGNSQEILEAHVSMNGDANLSFLHIPLTIPEMSLLYPKIRTPQLKDFSLWDRTGLKNLLKTPKQSFDLSINAQYKKNQESHSVPLPMKEVYDALSPCMGTLHQHFEKGTIPGTGFSLPSYTLVLPIPQFPVVYVPTSLRKLSLPHFRIMQPLSHIQIPALGNLTYDFSFKSSVITLNTDVGLYNNSDIVAHFRSSSSSVIDALWHKLDGTASLTSKRGLKLATALSLSNRFVEGNHDSAVSLTKKNLEASVTTTAKVQYPGLKVNFQHELEGNLKSKPVISSSVELKYDLNSAQLQSSARGNVDHKLIVESFVPYLSVETDTKGSMTGSVFSQKYSGAISSEANSYLDTKSMRSSVNFEGTSKMDGVWNIETKEIFAGEASLRHLYSIWEHSAKNRLQLRKGFSTNGDQNSKVTLELTPWTVSGGIQVHANQPSTLFKKASLGQVVTFTASLKDQRVSWKGEGHIQTVSLSHNIQLSNDPTEIRLDVAGSLEGYVSFLKDTLVPVYDSSIWDILKMDVTTSANKKQYLHISSVLVYTKSHTAAYWLSFPVKEAADGLLIPGPEPSSSRESGYIRLAKKTSMAPFALSLPPLPEVQFPRVEVSLNYSAPEGSTFPFFGVTVPEFQVTVSPIILPQKLSLAGAVLDLNEAANKIAGFDLPSVSVPEQSIRVPSLSFWLPAGIFLPSFGALAGDFQVASPVYNISWNSSMKNREDGMETMLQATCSSTVQPLEFDLNYEATYALEDGVLVGKALGTFSHKDLSVEYEHSFRSQGLEILEEIRTLKLICPTFTNIFMNYQKDRNSISLKVSCSPIGTLSLDSQENPTMLLHKVYYHPQVSPARKMDLMMISLSRQQPGILQLSADWNEDTASELGLALRAAWHRAGESLYHYVDRCHQEQTGLNISSASGKLRRLLQKRADEAYQQALNQIDTVDRGLGQAASTFQKWEASARHLYQMGHAGLWDLKNEALDRALRFTREQQNSSVWLNNRVLELLRVCSFQLPGQPGAYTGDDLGKALSAACARVHGALEALISYMADLAEKTAFLGLRKRLGNVSRNVQQRLNLLQVDKFKNVLASLGSFMDRVFGAVEAIIAAAKEKTSASFKSDFLNLVSHIFDAVSQRVEELRDALEGPREAALAQLQQMAQVLIQLHDYIKTLQGEYLDPTFIGWTLKYYETEDQIIHLARKIIRALMDFQSEAFERFLSWASRVKGAVETFKDTNVRDFLHLLHEADGNGKEKLQEFSLITQEKISVLATEAKEMATELHEQLSIYLQGTTSRLGQALQWANNKTRKVISLSVRGFCALLRFGAQLLRSLQGTTASSLNAHVQMQTHRLTITVPYPFQFPLIPTPFTYPNSPKIPKP